MAIRNIIKLGDETLRKKAKPVTEFNRRLHTLLNDMAETMRKAEGAGLAATQVGILKRVIVIDVGDGLVEMVNPIILDSSGAISEYEGCLSVPGDKRPVTRPKTVVAEAFDRAGNKFTVTAEDYFARAICHEIDHLNGVLFIDKTAAL